LSWVFRLLPFLVGGHRQLDLENLALRQQLAVHKHTALRPRLPQSPWQTPFAERLIGWIQRECLNHVLVLDERHLRRTRARYFSFYHQARTHLALDKDAPDSRPIELPAMERIVPISEVGGLH
jgi:hypothetical protein